MREFFDEKHVPILYIDMDLYLPKLNSIPLREARCCTALIGSHGRLDDLPLKSELRRCRIESGRPGPGEQRSRDTREARIFREPDARFMDSRCHGAWRRSDGTSGQRG